MKKIILNILLVSTIAFSFSSCKKDKDTGPTSYYSIGEASQKSLKSALFGYKSTASTNSKTGATFYRNEIDLISDGFVITNGQATSGTGDAIVLEIASASKSLDPGTYAFIDSEDNKPFDFWYGSAYIDYTLSTGTGDKYKFKDGKIVIAKSGDTYTIDFDGTLKMDGTTTTKTVKGHYVGLLESYERK